MNTPDNSTFNLKTAPIGEQQARRSPICRGCDKPKHPHELLIVCWGCFKYHCPKHPHPLKYSGLSFSDWQVS